ncbi:histidine phosphatase family protein [Streptomyces sp. NPDC048659]|uniref:histidine phosphatase family protein n=1 Tax=Streptomyces sp. NPDC048659 TaxID=3155489 RepID=UPI003417EF50
MTVIALGVPMRLLLIRHGQTAANLAGALDTAAPGMPLTEAGHRQAGELVGVLRDERIGAVFVSPLTRARQTAEPLAAALGARPRVRTGLRELEAGVWECSTAPDDVSRYAAVASAWASGRPEVPMPGAGDGTEFLGRFDAVVAEAAACGAEVAALVTHGTAVRIWSAARAANVCLGFVLENEVPNTGVVVVEGTPVTGWRVLSWAGQEVGERTASALVLG